MIDPTRRVIIGAVAASSLAALLRPSAAGAAAPATGKQAPGFYRYKVGGFECTSINDGALTYPISADYVTNVSKDQVIAAAEAAYFPKDMVVVPYNPQVINTGSKLLLIDTGWGPGVDPAVGQVPRNMAAAGIDPGTVDTVIVSHFHRDHINGLRKADGALAFPNAEIKVPAAEWAFWMSDDNMAKASGNMMQGNFANARKVFAGLADRVAKYEWGQEVVPGVTAIENSRSYSGAYIVCRAVRPCPRSHPVRCDQHSGPVRAPSRLARDVRCRAGSGVAHAPSVLRHGLGRKSADRGIPFPVPVAGTDREGRRRLPPGAVRLEPGPLDPLTRPGRDHPHRPARMRGHAHHFLCSWAWSGLVSMWAQPALVAQNSQARQVSVE